MLIYHFTIHNADGSDREETGRMALRDDNAARAFGKAIIRDIMTGDAVRYASWTMDISRGPGVRFTAFLSTTARRPA
jgi:hypothetical protein